MNLLCNTLSFLVICSLLFYQPISTASVHPLLIIEDQVSSEHLVTSLTRTIPAHFTAHYMALSNITEGSIYTEDLNRTAYVGFYNLDSYVGWFSTGCTSDFLCRTLTLADSVTYTRDYDTLACIDTNEVVAAFPNHTTTLAYADSALADASIKEVSTPFQSLLDVPNQNSTISVDNLDPSQLHLQCTPNALNIITLNNLDEVGRILVHSLGKGTLVIRTSSSRFTKEVIFDEFDFEVEDTNRTEDTYGTEDTNETAETIKTNTMSDTNNIERITKKEPNLLWLIDSPDFSIESQISGVIIAPSTTISLTTHSFTGSILCYNLISTVPLYGIYTFNEWSEQ